MRWRVGSPTGAPRHRRRQRSAGRRSGEPGRARGAGRRSRPRSLPHLVGRAECLRRHRPGGREGTRRVRRTSTTAAPRSPGVGTPAISGTRDLLVQGLGLKVSDEIDGVIAFLRCSPDHHNVALVESPVPLLQHYSGSATTSTTSATALRRCCGPTRTVTRGGWDGTSPDRTSTGTCAIRRAPTSSCTRTWTRSSTTRRGSAGTHAVRPRARRQLVGARLPLEFIVPPDLDLLQAAWTDW